MTCLWKRLEIKLEWKREDWGGNIRRENMLIRKKGEKKNDIK